MFMKRIVDSSLSEGRGVWPFRPVSNVTTNGASPDRQAAKKKLALSSAKGVVGVLDPDTGDVQSLTIGGGETVANGMASSPEGVAIVTTHALYLFDTDDSGAPEMLWREEYDRGTSVKPGQLT